MLSTWNALAEAVRSFTLKDLLQFLLENALLAASTVLIVYLTLWRKARRLASGDSDEILIGANYLVPIEGEANAGTCCLALRTIGTPTTSHEVFDNEALRGFVEKLARRTTPDDPILPVGGRIGFEAVNTLANLVCGTLSLASFPEGRWLLAVTSEDARMVRKRCVRVLLVREEDVPRLSDWAWCRGSVRFEKPYHAVRLWTLHRIIRRWREEQAARDAAAQGGEATMRLVDDQIEYPRVWPVVLRLPATTMLVEPPRAVDWNQLHELLAKLGATVGAAS